MRRSSAQGVLFGQTVANVVGISGSDLECLDFLNLEGRVTAGRLAEVTGLTTGAITGVVDRLEKAGLVRRERDPDDRRKVFIATVPENVAKIGRFYVHDAARRWHKLWSSPIRTPNCGCCCEFATKGYKTMLEATEELKSMIDAPKESRRRRRQVAQAAKPERKPFDGRTHVRRRKLRASALSSVRRRRTCPTSRPASARSAANGRCR